MSSASGLTPEEEQTLQKELPIVLEQHGANNKSKAKYVKMISDNVIGSANPKFFSMQPRVKDHNNVEAWKAAYLIIFNFIEEFKLDLTKEVMLNELKQNKIQKPPLPSMPPNYETNDISEVFSFQTVFEISNINDFKDNVEIFVQNHPKDFQQKSAAKPLNENQGAFLTQPNVKTLENNSPAKTPENVNDEDEEIDIIEDFNDYSGHEGIETIEDIDQTKDKEETQESKKDDEKEELMDINDFVDSEGTNDDKKEGEPEGEVDDEIIDDFNEDDVVDVVDDDQSDKQKQNSESDAQNSNMSISINSDMFEMNFDE